MLNDSCSNPNNSFTAVHTVRTYRFFPTLSQASRRIRTSRPIRKLRSSSFLCNFVIPGRNILITWAGLVTGTSMLSRANHGGGSSRSRTYGVSNVTSLQPAAIATMLIGPYGGKGYFYRRAPLPVTALMVDLVEIEST